MQCSILVPRCAGFNQTVSTPFISRPTFHRGTRFYNLTGMSKIAQQAWKSGRRYLTNVGLYYITNLLRLNRKWITYNRGSNDNFKFSWINYFPTCHNGFRKRLLSIDVRFPSINAKQAIGNIVNMIRKQQVKKGAQMVVGDACPN